VLLLGAGAWAARCSEAGCARARCKAPDRAGADADVGLKARANPARCGSIRKLAPMRRHRRDRGQAQSFAAGFAALKPFLSAKTVLLLHRGGTDVKAIAGQLGEDRLILRAMPNTPAAIGKASRRSMRRPAQRRSSKISGAALLAIAGAVVFLDDESRWMR